MRTWPLQDPDDYEAENIERIETIAEQIDLAKFRSDCSLCQAFLQLESQRIGRSEVDSSAESSFIPSNVQGDTVRMREMQIDYHYTREPDLEMAYFCVRYGGKENLDGRLWLFPMEKPDNAAERPVSRFRCAQPYEPGAPNFDQVKAWLTECRQHNATGRPYMCLDKPSRQEYWLKESFLVIDCLTRRVRHATENEPYICLSYVWGDIQGANASEDGLLPGKIPKTIEDAMEVAIKLEIPQLWVDQYCIDQKDGEDKRRMIGSMNVIYGAAELTIIAAAGTNSESGLPGIRGTLRPKPLLVDFEGFRMVVCHDIAQEIKDSRWNSRGWYDISCHYSLLHKAKIKYRTYQEALLSPRRIVFTNSQLYLQCRTHHYLEGLSHEFSDRHYYPESLSFALQVFPHDGVGPTWDLRERLAEYYSRRLTNGSDSLPAIEGILTALQEGRQGGGTLHGRHFYGLPFVYSKHSGNGVPSFVAALSWVAQPTQRITSGQCAQSNSGYPSWTWASLKARFPNVGLHLKWANDRNALEKDIAIRVARKGSDMVDFSVLHGPVTEKYTGFEPILEIDTWVIETNIEWDGTGCAKLPQYSHVVGKIHLDTAGDSRIEQQVIILCLSYKPNYQTKRKRRAKIHRNREVTFLLARRNGPGPYERLGIWETVIDNSEGRMDQTWGLPEILTTFIQPKDHGEMDQWKRKPVVLA